MGFGIRLEGELLADAIAEVERIRAALTHRHGDRFRRLERQIEALCADLPEPAIHPLGFDGEGIILLAAPPAQFITVIQEAKRLGV